MLIKFTNKIDVYINAIEYVPTQKKLAQKPKYTYSNQQLEWHIDVSKDFGFVVRLCHSYLYADLFQKHDVSC